MKNLPLLSAAALMLTASVAFAETAKTVTTPKSSTVSAKMLPASDFVTTIDSKSWLGSKVIGMPVYTSSTDERIGEINNIVISPEGQISSLVVGAGGFLGVGERNIAVKFASFKAMKDKDNNAKLTLDTTKDQLSKITEVKLPTETSY